MDISRTLQFYSNIQNSPSKWDILVTQLECPIPLRRAIAPFMVSVSDKVTNSWSYTIYERPVEILIQNTQGSRYHMDDAQLLGKRG